MEDGNLRFFMKRKGQYSGIAFCVNLAQLFILSYLKIPWNMFSFKNTHTLICFSSTIDENTDSVHWISNWSVCFLKKQSHIREWKENNRLVNFKWALISRKKARKIKDTSRDTSYKFKGKLAVIRRNIQYYTWTAL